MMFVAGPAATIAILADKLADAKLPLMRREDSLVILAAFSSPRILTYPPKGSAAMRHLVPFLSIQWYNSGPKPTEKTSTITPFLRAR